MTYKVSKIIEAVDQAGNFREPPSGVSVFNSLANRSTDAHSLACPTCGPYDDQAAGMHIVGARNAKCDGRNAVVVTYCCEAHDHVSHLALVNHEGQNRIGWLLVEEAVDNIQWAGVNEAGFDRAGHGSNLPFPFSEWHK